MEFQLDRGANALYIKLRPGKVARMIELSDSVYPYMDADDEPIGIEFLNVDEFLPFLCSHANDANLLPRVRELFRVTAA